MLNFEINTNYNKWYESSDGFFTYYVNKSTGEKKLKLEENDILVDRQWDDEMLNSLAEIFS